MADTQTTVTNLDIQLLDANRSNAATIKVDNPLDNITREQVASVFQAPLAKGWFLANNGDVAMYLGDITVNQSIKTKLGGEDFYITPAVLKITSSESKTGSFQISGASVQGYNYGKMAQSGTGSIDISSVRILDSGLTVQITVEGNDDAAARYDFQMVILGQIVDTKVFINRDVW